MRGVVMYAPGDVRVEDVEEPKIDKSTDAIIRLSSTCICGSDLWGLIWDRKSNPGKVFDLELPIDRAAEGYQAMAQRRAIKVLLRP